MELFMFAIFVFFSILDVKYRKIKLYWFVSVAVVGISYRLLFDFSSISPDMLMFGVSALVIGIAYVTRLFGSADLLGMLLLSFLLPDIGPFPTGISILVLTLIMQNYAIIFSNVSYNMSDLIQYHTIFHDTPQTKKNKLKSIYWFVMARRRRTRDRFVISAERQSVDGIRILSARRGNKLLPDTKYVFSAHPLFVFSTVSFFLLLFFAVGLGYEF